MNVIAVSIKRIETAIREGPADFRIGENAYIEPCVVIGHDVVIGDNGNLNSGGGGLPLPLF